MARWALCWLLLIACATVITLSWTNSLVDSTVADRVSYAMLPLDDLGSATCSSATRSMAAAAAGSAPGATPEQQAAYEKASRAVLLACGHI